MKPIIPFFFTRNLKLVVVVIESLLSCVSTKKQESTGHIYRRGKINIVQTNRDRHVCECGLRTHTNQNSKPIYLYIYIYLYFEDGGIRVTWPKRDRKRLTGFIVLRVYPSECRVFTRTAIKSFFYYFMQA